MLWEGGAGMGAGQGVGVGQGTENEEEGKAQKCVVASFRHHMAWERG